MSAAPASSAHVLYVDDEEKALQYFRKIFGGRFTVHTASSAAEGFRLLQELGDEIAVLITDQRMPGETGVSLLERARRLNPNIVRILLTAYSDYDIAVRALNDGRAFRYLHKPVDPNMLGKTLEEAMAAHATLLERERLLAEKAEFIRHSLMADRVAGMSIMADGLNHHLRNALTVVRAFVDLAPMKLMDEIKGRSPKDSHFWVETQQHAQAQIDRIQSMLTHLAHASHPHKILRRDQVTLQEVLEDAYESLRGHLQDRGLEVAFRLPPDLPRVLVHGERFRQLWRLLFIEEITHLQSGDEFAVQAELEQGASGQDFLVMRLTDNGVWAAKDDRAIDIFNPFYSRSRKPDEFGINMMACYVTLHLHGGTMDARRIQPHGLELTMRLPLDPAYRSPESEEFFRRASAHEARWRAREERAA
jgi:two-component system probable response regulator PhcQ